MKFPEISRNGDPCYVSAIARLTAARREERRLAVAAHADELEAASRLSAATVEVAAREAWVGWVERRV